MLSLTAIAAIRIARDWIKGNSIAEHALVADAHLGHGNVLLFGNDPVYRGETVDTYPSAEQIKTLEAP